MAIRWSPTEIPASNAGVAGFDPGDDDRACVGRIRLESGVLGTKDVAVDEQRKVAEERRRDDERPERR